MTVLPSRPTWRPGPAPDDDRPSAIPSGRLLAGRYRIDGVLGHGGMATVYAAWDRVLGRDVAVKVVDADGVDARAAFEREIRLGAGLRHPAITPVLDGGRTTVDGRDVPYLVLELAERGDLRKRLATGSVDWRTAASIGADLAAALAHLHDRGYLHRDVKPANVLLVGREVDGPPRVQLCDLGIGSRWPTDREVGDRTLGTAAYISPEQVQGRPATDRSDVYSLGLVLLEALSGVVEYPGDVQRAAVARLRRDPVIPGDLPRTFGDLLRAMTERSPRHRPTAVVVHERLRGLLVEDAARRLRTAPRSAEARAAAVVEALERYDVVGWPPRRAFAAATALAARSLDVRWACVVLADVDGLHVSDTAGWPELPVEVRRWDWLVDPDRTEPWARGALPETVVAGAPGGAGTGAIRAAAGAPLVTIHGDVVGALCVFDDRERLFSPRAIADLATLASMVVSELELRLAARRALFSR